jgi:hypothetical protein
MITRFLYRHKSGTWKGLCISKPIPLLLTVWTAYAAHNGNLNIQIYAFQ